MYLVENQTTEQSAREYKFLSKATEPVRKIILAEDLRKGWRVQEGSQESVTSTCTTSGKCGLQRGDEGQRGEDGGDDGKADRRESRFRTGMDYEMKQIGFTKPGTHETSPSRVSNVPSAETGPGRDGVRACRPK